MKASLEQAIVEALKALPGPANLRDLASALEIPMAALAAEIQRLRYQGKVAWDRLALSPSMISADGVASAVKAEGAASTQPSSADGHVSAAPAHPSQPGPDDEEDDGLNDVAPAQPSFVPRALLHRAGVHAAQTRAAARPVAPPEHEPEIARLVREEVEEKRARRSSARSTGTVRQPLELKKYGVPDMSFSEAIGSMLSDDPRAILRAVSRKHPAMWRRCILLGRATGKSPMQALYTALESGLDQLEQQEHADGA